MGKQIEFYCLKNDNEMLFSFLKEKWNVIFVERSGDAPSVVSVSPPLKPGRTYCIWNPGILETLEREYIQNAEREHYRVDEFLLPVLELTLSIETEWEKRPALVMGRIYGIFERKPVEFLKWYEAIVRFIRKNFHRNHGRMGGYIGPAAMEWHQRGGLLLPIFIPPVTDAWKRVLLSQSGE